MADIDKYIRNRDKLQFSSSTALFKMAENFSATVGPVASGSMDDEIVPYSHELTGAPVAVGWFRAPTIANVWGPLSMDSFHHYLSQGIEPSTTLVIAVETASDALRFTVDNFSGGDVTVEFKGTVFYG